MSFKGYTSFVKDHMDLKALGVVILGLSLPSIAGYLQSTNIGSKVGAQVNRFVPGATSDVGKAVMAVTLTAAVSYGMMGLGVINAKEALSANMIALGLVTVAALKTSTMVTSRLPMVDSLPSAGINGLGASYGYIGNYHNSGMGVGADMLPPPQSQQLFGVRANIF